MDDIFFLFLKVIENLDVHLEGSEHFKFLWYPHTDGVVVSHCSRTTLVSSVLVEIVININLI